MKSTNTFRVEIEISYRITEQGNEFLEKYQKFYKRYSNRMPTLEEAIYQYIVEAEMCATDDEDIDPYYWAEEVWWFGYFAGKHATEELKDFVNELAEFLASQIVWDFKKVSY